MRILKDGIKQILKTFYNSISPNVYFPSLHNNRFYSRKLLNTCGNSGGSDAALVVGKHIHG